jgi:hypothetical protein
MAKRCEDYPCCGHTEQDPCDPEAFGFKTSAEWANDPHLMCDHENGICEADDKDYDEDEDTDDEDEEADDEDIDKDYDIDDEEGVAFNTSSGRFEYHGTWGYK